MGLMKMRVSQYDAEFVADLTNMLNAVYTGGVSDSFKKEFAKIDVIRMKLWQMAFGEMSNWKAVRGKNNKVVVEEKGV